MAVPPELRFQDTRIAHASTLRNLEVSASEDRIAPRIAEAGTS
jgi:hypothetical protein